MATNSVLARLAVQISANTSEFNKSLKDTQNTLKNFVGNFQSAAAAIGVGFGAQQVGQFAIETAKLAGQADAVRVAFERLPEATKLMSQLKQATSNTVSEFDLMKAAVKASNFQIELSQLPKLLQFATLRAQQTGQSVDYLVESIIMGIGRKSPMILDNLGISLVRLREKLKGVGTESASVAQMTEVVGQIANEDLQNMSGFATNAATKIEQIAAAYTDLKVSIGNNLQQSNHYNSLLENVKNQLIVWNSSEVSFWTKLFSSAKEYQQIVADIESKQRAAAGEIGPTARTYDQFYNNLIQNAKTFGATMAAQLAPTEEDKKQQEKLLDQRQDAWKRFGISIQAINKANDNDLKRFEKWSVDYLKTQINNFRELGDATSQFGQVFQTNLESIQEITQSRIAAGPILPKMIGTPEDIRKMIDNIILLGGAIETVNESVESAGSAMENFAENAIANLAELGGMLAAENISFKDFGKAILESVAEFMQAFGRQLITIGIGKEAFDKLFESVGGGYLAIAAGVALVAAGGAIKGGIENRMKRQQEMQSVARTNTGMGGRTYGSSVEVTGRLVGSGRDLVAVIDSTNFDNKYRKGG